MESFCVSSSCFLKHNCDLSLGHQPTSMHEAKALSAFPESNENNMLWPLQDDTCSEPGAGIPGDPNIPSNYVRQFLHPYRVPHCDSTKYSMCCPLNRLHLCMRCLGMTLDLVTTLAWVLGL